MKQSRIDKTVIDIMLVLLIGMGCFVWGYQASDKDKLHDFTDNMTFLGGSTR